MDQELEELFNRKCLICDIEAEIRTCQHHYSLEMHWRMLSVHLDVDAYAISLYPTVLEFRDTSIPIRMIREGFDMSLVEDYYLANYIGSDFIAEVIKSEKPKSWDIQDPDPPSPDIELFQLYGYQSAIYIPSCLGNSRAICVLMSKSPGIVNKLRNTLYKVENCLLATHASMQDRFYHHYTPYTFELTQTEYEVWSLLCNGLSIDAVMKARGTGRSAVNQIIKQLKESLYPNKSPEEIKEIKTNEITNLLRKANYF